MTRSILVATVTFMVGCASAGSRDTARTASARAEAPPAPAPAGAEAGAPKMGANVRFEGLYDVALEGGALGLRLRVFEWTRGAVISFYLVGPAGEIIEVLPLQSSASLERDGELSLDIPYGMPGLYVGSWKAVVAGPDDGIHHFTVQIPPAAGQPPSENTFAGSAMTPAEETGSTVGMSVYGDQKLPQGLGILVTVSGWVPGDNVEIYALDAKQGRVDLLRSGATLPVAKDGSLSLSIPYSHEGLYPGEWLLVVEGASGKHGHKFTVGSSAGK